jgi:hypothetical protein
MSGISPAYAGAAARIAPSGAAWAVLEALIYRQDDQLARPAQRAVVQDTGEIGAHPGILALVAG